MYSIDHTHEILGEGVLIALIIDCLALGIDIFKFHEERGQSPSVRGWKKMRHFGPIARDLQPNRMR